MTSPPPVVPSSTPDAPANKIGRRSITTTSGVLRDARNGAPIPSSCVGYRTATSPQASFTNVNSDGSWSFQTDDLDGPVSLAFYVVDNYNCSGPVVSGSYLPSWYQNQPFDGTDPGTAVPPDGETTVNPGRSGIVACLAPDQLPNGCATPNTTFSGRVLGTGPHPIDQACIFALGPTGPVGQTITAADGRWTLTDLPIDYPFVIGVIPPFDTGAGPCRSDGPPPMPADGELQPEFYTNTWANLADPDLLNDPYTWATAHGAQSITNSKDGIDVCLTTDPGNVVPRPPCEPPTPTPEPTDSPHPTQNTTPPASSTTGHTLAATGGPSALLAALGASMLLLGADLLRRSRFRRH